MKSAQAFSDNRTIAGCRAPHVKHIVMGGPDGGLFGAATLSETAVTQALRQAPAS